MRGKHKDVYDNQGEDDKKNNGSKKKLQTSIKSLFAPKDKDDKLTPEEKARRLHAKVAYWICDTNQPLCHKIVIY
jgi:hypothetical protein